MNKKATTPTTDEFDEEESVMAEMCAVMDNLRRHNQIFEVDVFHIQQRQQEIDLIKKVEILDP